MDNEINRIKSMMDNGRLNEEEGQKLITMLGGEDNLAQEHKASENITLSINHLSKVYEKIGESVIALEDVSFDLYEGELLAIMGTSGSGKSTLLNIVGAMDKPSQGEIYLHGAYNEAMFEEPDATIYRRNNIGFIFQSFHLLKDLSVEENIALPLILKNISNTQTKRKVEEILEVTGLTKWRTHRPIELSGGQQQRVAIGRAIITSPPIVLADELTGNLDFNTSTDILRTLIEMKERFNQSMMMVTHDPSVASYADRVLFFHDGKIVDEYTCLKDKTDMDHILHTFKSILELAA